MSEPRRLDALVEKARQRETPWGEPREARVWAGIDQGLASPPRRRWPLVLAVAAMAVAGLSTLSWLRTDPTSEVAELLPPSVQTSRLTFPGEAMGYAAGDAHAEVVTATQQQVRVRQRAGRIEYHVQPGRPRRFTVEAADVEVSVLGTAFLVTVEAGSVRVEVAHGRVQVRRGADVVMLTDKESLTLSQDSHDAGLLVAPTPSLTPESLSPPTPDAGPPVEPTPVVAPVKPLDLEAVLEKADRLRSAGRYDAAAGLLADAVKRSPSNARSPALAFTQGRVEQGRGRHQAAAAAFARCFALEPGGALAEDALTEEAFSWSRAGQPERATATATRALERFPQTIHRARLEGLRP